jgi:hypothetical protein
VTRSKGLRPTRLTPDFEAISRTALAVLPALLGRWLPDGRFEGNEYTALNPRRADRRPGSFKVNIRTGKWADFACDVTGVGSAQCRSSHAISTGARSAVSISHATIASRVASRCCCAVIDRRG